MGPKEKGVIDHTTTSSFGLPKWKTEMRTETQPKRKGFPLCLMGRTPKCAKMSPDRFVEADILGSLEEQINITVSLTIQN